MARAILLFMLAVLALAPAAPTVRAAALPGSAAS